LFPLSFSQLFNPFGLASLTLGRSLILGPAFFSAWAYTVLGYCITRLGSAYSLVKPKMYLAIFVTADVISLVLQAIGGGKAAVAAEGGTDTKPATRISGSSSFFRQRASVEIVSIRLG